jgi:hypothetical protein
MTLSNYLRSHNELIEMLIEGGNPHALNKLTHDEMECLRNQLDRDERICAYVRGRAVGAGRGIWVLTERSLVLLVSGGPVRERKLSLRALESVESQRGRYGQTLRVHIDGQTHALYGCDTTRAALAARVLSARHPLALAQTALDDEALANALHAFAELGLRVQPLAQTGDTAREAMQAAIARARADGLVQATELAS